MKIYNWHELKAMELKDFPVEQGLIWFVFHSKDILSSELKSLLKDWIAEVGGIDVSSLTEAKGKNGKPYFVGTKWKFNLSHSGDLTVVGLHPSLELGVDIETWKPKKRMLPIAERYFSPDEVQLLSTISQELEWEARALEMFTIKESLIKLQSGSLFKGLGEFNSLSSHPEVILKFIQSREFALSISLAKSLDS
jgi:phosphopantetheinyl transferase